MTRRSLCFLNKKATKIDKNLPRQFEATYVVNVKSMVKILSILVAFLKNMNFTYPYNLVVELFNKLVFFGASCLQFLLVLCFVRDIKKRNHEFSN